VPICRLTSRRWSNFYFDWLDHWIAEMQRHSAYLRYIDDVLLFDENKARWWELQTEHVRYSKGRIDGIPSRQ